MKYSFLENNNTDNNFKINKKHLFEYDQFAEDEEYDEETDDYDPEVAKLLDYKLKNADELNNILLEESISLEEKEKYIILNKNLLNEKDKYGNTALIRACREKKLELVELLLENGADINERGNYGDTALILASEYDIPEIVKLLLENGADVNIQNNYGQTALMMACEINHPEIVELLLQHDADVNIKDSNECTALIKACAKSNNIDIVKLLLDHGADPNIGDKQERTALWQACISGYIAIVKLLLEYGVNPNGLNAQVGSSDTILISACRNDDFDTAKLLLEYGADPNKTNGYEKTALFYAYKNNNLELVKLLLEYGANIYYYLINEFITDYKIYNNMLDSILQFSSKSTIQKSCYEFCNYLINKPGDLLYKKLYILEALMDYGAKISPNIFYNLVIKAFDIYTDHSYSDYYSLSKYLGLFKKILDDINISEISISKKGDKAIGCLIKTLIHENLVSNFNYIKELLNLMSNIDVNLPSDETLLTYALRFSNLSYGYELVKLLLKHGADPNKKNKKGFTPLGVALKFGNNKIIKLLSKDGIDTNNLTGQYALISALRSENYKLAKQLIKDNIDINVEYSDRYQSRLSPFSIILRISEDKIRLPLLKLIIEHGLDVNSRDILVSITRSKLAQKDKESIIRLLLKKGADINKSNCLKFSLFDKDIELFNFLLKNGANINRTDSDGDTILLEVVRDKYNTRFDDSTVKLLLKHKIDVNKRNNKLETALYWSITNNNNDYTKLLLEHGADPNIHIMKGDTVLHLAVRNKDIGLIKLLLEYDADPNIKNNSGKSPLDIAKTKEIKNILLKKD